MKKNAVPELDYKWWDKNKPLTLKKTGLGGALKDYQIAADKFDHAKAIEALSEVKRKVANSVTLCGKSHEDTVAALKRYPAIIQKKENDHKAALKAAAAKGASAAAPLKQRIGKSVVVWKRDISAEVVKKFNPPWLKKFSGYELKMTLNEDILDVFEKEEDYVTPAFIAQDAEELGQKLIGDLVAVLKRLDAAKGKPAEVDALRESFAGVAEKAIKAYQTKFEKIPQDRWKKFVSQKAQYKAYKIKAGLDVTVGVLGVVGSAAGIVGSGGAGLALGIVALVRSAASVAKQVHDLARDAEGIEKMLRNDLETLQKRYQNAQGEAKKGKQGATEVGTSVLKGILGVDPPFLATIPKCDSNLSLWENKVAGLTVAGRNLSKIIMRALAECDKLEKQIKNAANAEARKVFVKLVKARSSLGKALDECIAMNARVDKAEKNMGALKKMLAALKVSNPKYAEIFDRVFPAVVNLALAGASAGVSFKEAANTLEYFSTGLDLFNEIASEGKSQLEEALG